MAKKDMKNQKKAKNTQKKQNNTINENAQNPIINMTNQNKSDHQNKFGK